MRGVVLAELVDFIDASHGVRAVEAVLAGSELTSGGAYTRVGFYPHHEYHAIVTAFSSLAGRSASDISRDFGRHLFRRLVLLYPESLETGTAFGMLRALDSTIHATVIRLYPDAEVPRFLFPACPPGELRLVYESRRGMADLAHGLIEGCLELFREDCTIKRTDLSPDGSLVEFHLRPAGRTS